MRIEETAAYIGPASEVEVDAGHDAARDERQTRDYVSGVTRWKRWLDFVLSQFTRGDLDALEPPLRQILRIGLYDLLILGTPPHAAVNEAVELTHAMVRPQAARLANGVLRNVVRSLDNLPEPTEGSEAKRLAIRHSHPTWMVRRWLERFGTADTVRLLETNNRRPHFGLRINTRRITMEDYEAELQRLEVAFERSPYLDGFLRVGQLQLILAAGHLREGLAAVQDESAGLVVRVLDPQPGERVLDLCAAPGGKALHAAERMEDQGELLAVDVHPARLRLVAKAASARGYSSIQTMAADGRTLDPNLVGLFDRVLLDAPCSGLGVLSRRADLRWIRHEGDLDELTALQDALLTAAARLVRPGGLLVYGTCTIEPDENRDRIELFLESHPEFSAERADGLVAKDVLDEDGFLSTLPHVHEINGAFGARLRRRS